MLSSGRPYDHLLALARLEHELASEARHRRRFYKFASGMIALAGISVVTVGGYLLFMHISVASGTPANQVDVTARTRLRSLAGQPGRVTGYDRQERIACETAECNRSWSGDRAGRRHVPARCGERPGGQCRPGSDPAAPNARSLRAQRVSPTASTMAATSSTTCGNSAVPSPTSHRRSGRKSQAVPNLPQQRPAGTALIRSGIAPSVTPVSRQQTAAQDPSREEGVATARLP